MPGSVLYQLEEIAQKNGDGNLANRWHIDRSAIFDIRIEVDPPAHLKDSVYRAGMTALHLCAKDAEKLEAAKLLLEHKRHVDVDAADFISRTALYLPTSKPFKSQREAMVIHSYNMARLVT